MQIRIIAVGTKVTPWVVQGCNEYIKRLTQDLKLQIIEVEACKRYGPAQVEKILEEEGKKLLSKVPPDYFIIALERTAKSLSTLSLAKQIQTWKDQGQNICFLIGGPEGIANSCLQKANLLLSLSELTLPHQLVRIIICEQIYRAWSIISHHPYHR